MKTEHSTHKSIMIAIREAATLYLFNRNREKDIPKIADFFLSLDDYPGERVPVAEVVKEVNALSSVLQDSHLGLNLNMLVEIESLPIYKAINECLKPFSHMTNELPFLLVSRIVFRFFFLLTQSIELKLNTERGLIRFEFISNAPESMNKNQMDGAMVLVHRILEDFSPGMLNRVCVAYRHSDYELEYYQSVFGVFVESADTTSLIYNLDCHDHYKKAASLLIKSEEELGRKFFINPLFNMLSTQFSGLSYKERCEIAITTIMGITPPTRDHVADAMSISVSTLQRRLKEEGTSFQRILEETRRQLAELYLTEKQLSTTDVAYLLGYKSHSQFFKAFKACFGITPKAYQTNLINRT